MKMKKGGETRMILIAVAALVLIIPSVFALGITPGRTTFNFEPGVMKEITFSIINSLDENSGVRLLVDGELSSSISLPEGEFIVPSKGEKKINASFLMPLSLGPGPHKASIIATASAGSSGDVGGTYLGAVVGVATEIIVLVPYPGKYLDVGMNVAGPDSSGEIQFVFPAINRGLVDIEKASVVIDVFDATDRKIATIGTGEFPIKSAERKELIARWNAAGVAFGKYRFSATIFYDNETKIFGNYLTIGEPIIDIKDIKVNNFKLGGIAKFEIKLKNMWNENVSDVYTDIVVYDNRSRVIADFKSASETIAAGEEKVLTSYWDTSNVDESTYDSAVAIVYNDKSNEKKFKLEVQENRINVIGVSYVISGVEPIKEGSKLIIALVIAIIALVIINALWFLYFRKKIKPAHMHRHGG